jgi:hypothetical protein
VHVSLVDVTHACLYFPLNWCPHSSIDLSLTCVSGFDVFDSNIALCCVFPVFSIAGAASPGACLSSRRDSCISLFFL